MGADLFGSLAESTCAALLVGATSDVLIHTVDAIYFPLMVTSMGIWVSFVTTFFATNFRKITFDNVENTIKWQLIISTVLMTGAIMPLIEFLPESFTMTGYESYIVTPWKAFGCVACGLWAGLIIGYITEIYTSNAYSPV
jgi:Na+/H+-translocating membrane pyrophosphatase